MNDRLERSWIANFVAVFLMFATFYAWAVIIGA